MPVTAARFRARPRTVGGIVVLAVAAALSVATLSSPQLAGKLGEGLSAGVEGMKTVAAMLADRSPGQRPDGALANLKPKRQPAIHERALPKVRGPNPTAFDTLVGPPPPPSIVPPPEAPLYTAVAGPPLPVPPITGGTTGGGPPGLSNIPLPGGGGGIFSPPEVVTSTPEVPQTPVPAVPEPASWAMMIFGFALIGRMMRRRLMPVST